MSKDENLMIRWENLTFYLAPLALLSSSVLYIIAGDGMNNGVLGGFVQCAAMFLFIFPMMSITRFIGHAIPLTALIMRILLILGCVMGFTFGIDSVLNATQPNGYTILEMKYTSTMLWTLGPIWPVCLGVTGLIGLFRKLLPTLPALLLALAGFSFPAGRIPKIDFLYLLTDLLMIIAFAVLLRTIRKTSWDERGAPSLSY